MIIYCFWCWPFTSVLIFMLRCRCYWIKCTSKVPMLSIRWCCPSGQGKQPSLSSCNIIFLTSPMESPCTHNWFLILRLVLPTGQCPGQHDMTSNCLSPVELFTKSWPFILSSPTLDMRVNMLRRTGKDFKGMDLWWENVQLSTYLLINGNLKIQMEVTPPRATLEIHFGRNSGQCGYRITIEKIGSIIVMKIPLILPYPY